MLIIDDDAGFVHFVGSVLRMDGHKVVAAQDAKEAISLLQAKRCDLILLDTTIKGQKHTEALARLKEDPFLGDIPVVLMADDFTPKEREQALASRAADFIAKKSGAGGLSFEVYRVLERTGG